MLKRFINKEKLKGMLVGGIIATILMSSILSFADSEAITAYLSNIKVLVNGTQVQSDVAPIVYNGRTLLPVRALADALGKDVGWDAVNNTVTINDRKTTVKEDILPTRDIEDSKNVVNIPVVTPTPKPIVATPTPTLNVEYVFRKVNWGMTRQQVVDSEGKNPDSGSISGGSLLMYKTSISSTDCDLFYEFNDYGQLCRISILGRETHTNKNDFINDYNRIVSTLSTKYGTPSENETIWVDDLYKDEPSRYGFAVSYGHLKYFSRWDLDKTIVGGMLSGDNFELGCYFFMQSRELEQRKNSSGI